MRTHSRMAPTPSSDLSPERVGGLRFGGIAFVGVDLSEESNCACSDVCSDGYYGSIIYTDTPIRGEEISWCYEC